jgi:ABC-type microcin C transport system permease subunit YejB
LASKWSLNPFLDNDALLFGYALDGFMFDVTLVALLLTGCSHSWLDLVGYSSLLAYLGIIINMNANMLACEEF